MLAPSHERTAVLERFSYENESASPISFAAISAATGHFTVWDARALA